MAKKKKNGKKNRNTKGDVKTEISKKNKSL